MASDDKKTKSAPAPKAESPAKKPKEAAAKTESAPAADAPKAESSEKSSDRPKSYSRGEGQKPVTQAYKDNWNAIFGDKKKKKR